MFIIKKKYYLFIENTKDLDVASIKNKQKISIVFRRINNSNISEILKFRHKCKCAKIKFYVANDIKVAKMIKADGLYISAYNKKKYYINIPKIGSAHNLKEINEKIKQNCEVIILSRLFETNYEYKKSFLGVIKFNLLSRNLKKSIYPLGGINIKNFLKLNMVNSKGFAFMTAVKKKPAITSRLF